MTLGRSYNFTHDIVRILSSSMVQGLSTEGGGRPGAELFLNEHLAYTNVLCAMCYVLCVTCYRAKVTVLPRLEKLPDSIFVEDAALCIADTS